MIYFDKSKNLLEEDKYQYELQDVKQPELFRDLYPYDEIPKVVFNYRHVPMNMPEEIWITDTTFRDGQQSTSPFTVKQIVDIFKKMNLTRAQAMDKYLGTVKSALSHGIRPRCHFEDITRADFYGFVVPFANELMKLSRESGIPIKIRMCDTMGFGVTYPGTSLPRSVQGIVYGLHHHSEVPSSMLEWHGHNDFYKVVTNAATAWLYGASGVNCSLLGIGERTGNCPLEAMAVEYASLRGTTDGMDFTAITDIAHYFEDELGYIIPPMTPFVGRAFNATRAGIHADGMLKDPEIYNIFDTAKILGRPARVSINNASGLAGIAYWINDYYDLPEGYKIDKKDVLVVKMKEQIDSEYASGRNSIWGDDELDNMIRLLDRDRHREFVAFGRSK